MNHKTYIGIDNGSSGTIGIIHENGDTNFLLTPVRREQDYVDKKKYVKRLDWSVLREVLKDVKEPFALVERPLKNSRMSTDVNVFAGRFHESTICLLELLQIPYEVIDSGRWQKDSKKLGTKGMLPSNAHGKDLKLASGDKGVALFPQYKDLIKGTPKKFKGVVALRGGHGDADGLLMAEWARRNNL